MQKCQVREKVKIEIEQMDSVLKKKYNSNIIQHCLELDEFRQAESIGVFLYQGEINTNPLIEMSLDLGKSVFAICFD
jgi:5-formyltetrahydrofolate cyclo-ligase